MEKEQKQEPVGKGQERAKESLALNLPILGKKVVLDDITPVGGGRSSCLKCGQMLSGRWMWLLDIGWIYWVFGRSSGLRCTKDKETMKGFLRCHPQTNSLAKSREWALPCNACICLHPGLAFVLINSRNVNCSEALIDAQARPECCPVGGMTSRCSLFKRFVNVFSWISKPLIKTLDGNELKLIKSSL